MAWELKAERARVEAAAKEMLAALLALREAQEAAAAAGQPVENWQEWLRQEAADRTTEPPSLPTAAEVEEMCRTRYNQDVPF